MVNVAFGDGRQPGYADRARRVCRATQAKYAGLSTLSWADQEFREIDTE